LQVKFFYFITIDISNLLNLNNFLFFNNSIISFSVTYKVSKDGSTSTLIKHLRNKHNNLIAAEKKVVGVMDKFVKRTDELVCIIFNFFNLYF